MSKELRDSLTWVASYNLSVAAIVYAWLAFFVLGLSYDYVTTASILFSLFLAVLVLTNLSGMIKLVQARDPWGAGGLAIGILLAMASLTGGLGVFVAIHHPAISDRFDMVSGFWGVLGFPFVAVIHAIASLVPAVGKFLSLCARIAEASDILSNALGSLLAGALTALFFRDRLSGKAKAISAA